MSIKYKQVFYVNEDKDTNLHEIFEGITEKMTKNLLPGDYSVFILDRKKSRSMGQLKYYMGVVCKMISKELGYTVDEVHEILKETLMPLRVLEVKGKTIEIISSKNLNSKEMGDYIEKVIAWAWTELNLHIPTKEELAAPPPPKSNYQDIAVDAENDHWIPKKDRKK